ncbi:MAG: hypothetical protein KatS3mg105_2539 [Gemmatales bacterium]|nr:MAG: hypothetical protein KatS3mg105_2539 [Gemmatales bacterium]
MKKTRVLVLFNKPVLTPGEPDYEAEQDIIYTVDVVTQALRDGGYHVCLLGVGNEPEVLLKGIRKERPDVIFNLYEGIADLPKTESYVAALVEWLDIPYTGSKFRALSFGQRKHLVKTLFVGAGLPTAEFFVVERLPVTDCPIEFPVIIKPAEQDASVGIDQNAVAVNSKQLNDRVGFILEEYGPPVLVERFLRGRELNVALIELPELRPLPPSEILFVDDDPNYWPLISYDSKWRAGSRDDRATPPKYPAEVSDQLREQLQDLACKAFRLLDCSDYARVDFRLDEDERPYILEVNPNPDISPNAGFAKALKTIHLPYETFVCSMVENCLRRKPRPRAEQSALAAIATLPEPY